MAKDEINKDELKLVVIKAATMALDEKAKDKLLDTDGIVPLMMQRLDEKGKAKFVGIAAASKAIEYKIRRIGNDKDILKKVMDESDEIIDSVLDEE